MLCREKTLIKDHEAGFYATPLCCRSWTCDYCQPERRARVSYQARLGQPDTFITLTTNPARAGTPASRAAELVDAWRRFVRFAKRHYGYGSIPYMAVFEATKLGQPHLHILARVKWIDQRLLSSFMREAIKAPVVDIRRCTSTRAAARYVSKYVGKAPGKFGTCKRYWRTKDYILPPEHDAPTCEFAGGGWRIVDKPWSSFQVELAIATGRAVAVGPIYKFLTHAPP